MKGTIELKKPILIDGVQVSSLPFDDDAITVAMYMKANADAMATAGPTTSLAAEFDFSFHVALGMYAVVAVNHALDYLSLKNQVRGRDISKFAAVGRNFTLNVEDPDSETSEEQSESSAGPSTLQLQSSEE